MSDENKIAMYEKKTIREVELELSIFMRDKKSCSQPRRLHWLEEHIEFLERVLVEKRL